MAHGKNRLLRAWTFITTKNAFLVTVVNDSAVHPRALDFILIFQPLCVLYI